MSYEEQTVFSRREWLKLTTVNALACAASAQRTMAQSTSPSLRESRIRRVIQAYEEQGFHRTGTSVDNASAAWLRDEIGAIRPDRFARTIPASPRRPAVGRT